jgi:hypothetical protein
MKQIDPTEFHRKSGVWGTQVSGEETSWSGIYPDEGPLQPATSSY